MSRLNRIVLLVVLTWVIANPGTAQSSTSISKLHFIGEYVVDFNHPFKDAPIGGLSGIDYDKSTDTYYLICDAGEAHYYKAKIYFTLKGIDSIRFTDVSYFLNSNGKRLQAAKKSGSEVDPESIRFNPLTQTVFWSSEGERSVKEQAFIDPAIYQSKNNGEMIGTLPIPENLKMSKEEKGPRRNGTFEGMTFADNYKTLYVSLEEPLYQDGPRASLTPTNSWVRFYQYRMADMKNVAQYAYKLDPIALPPIPAASFSVNGISEILSTGNKTMLVMERSYSTGHLGCVIKVFHANLAGATDIKNVLSLSANPPAKEIEKKLLLNFNDLNIYIDNVEGLTFGPDFPNGHKSLIFVADNNFNPLEKTQFLLFEVIP
ncbi:MAG: esterase-like activity of phytase family protein [Bacteroidetes bacterium]|nr:esterase-like activity of phytase family protein [Bacteroidota bacterium]MBS1539185.1 esterase-like activity of phytase family protein [Bacteroidota bacterium]